jgi:hypothetical protein
MTKLPFRNSSANSSCSTPYPTQTNPDVSIMYNNLNPHQNVPMDFYINAFGQQLPKVDIGIIAQLEKESRGIGTNHQKLPIHTRKICVRGKDGNPNPYTFINKLVFGRQISPYKEKSNVLMPNILVS